MKKNKKRIIYIVTIILAVLIGILVCTNYSNAEELATWEFQFGGEDSNHLDTALAWSPIGWVINAFKIIVLIVLAIVKGIFKAISILGIEENINSPADIIFNNVSLTSVSFFNSDVTGITKSLQGSISQWYYVIRNISVIILLGILLYVGIRMAISTVASEEAKYKKMFKDWAVSLILVYVLQYIMIIIIDINNILVNVLANAFAYDSESDALAGVMGYLYQEAWSVSIIQGYGCTILYGILIMMTFLFLIMYIKRVIITAFLIVISPLITITYSIDKMGDGKSQALNNWLKEFAYNILIQPFHCIIYGTLVITSVSIISTEKSVGALIFAIVAMIFTYKAEDLVKKIFGVQPSSLGSVVAGAGMALAALGMLNKKNSNAKKIPGKFGNDKAPNISNSSSIINGGANNNGSNASPTNANNNLGGNNSTGANGNSTSNGTAGGNSAFSPKSKKQRFFGAAKNIGKSYAIGSAKVGTAAAFAMVGLGTGDIKGAFAGAAAGSGIARGVENAQNNAKYNSYTKQNEKVLASEFGEWAQYQPEYENGDNEGLIDKVAAILDTDLKENPLSESNMKIRRFAEGMQKNYEAGGEDSATAREHVLNTLKEIQNGDIVPVDEAPHLFEKNRRTYESTGGYSREYNDLSKQEQIKRDASQTTSKYDETDKKVAEIRKKQMEDLKKANEGKPETMDSI